MDTNNTLPPETGGEASEGNAAGAERAASASQGGSQSLEEAAAAGSRTPVLRGDNAITVVFLQPGALPALPPEQQSPLARQLLEYMEGGPGRAPTRRYARPEKGGASAGESPETDGGQPLKQVFEGGRLYRPSGEPETQPSKPTAVPDYRIEPPAAAADESAAARPQPAPVHDAAAEPVAAGSELAEPKPEESAAAPAMQPEAAAAASAAESVSAAPEQLPAEKPAPLTDEEVLATTARKWKYKAPPPAAIEPEPTENTVPRELAGSCSQLIGARVRGKKHKHEGTNCDDWFEFAAAGDVTIAAVADGAGSRRFSRIGARVSCETAVGLLQAAFDGLGEDPVRYGQIREALRAPLDSAEFTSTVGALCETVQTAVTGAIGAVEEAFQERQGRPGYEVSGRELQLGDFACTLLVLVALPAGDGEQLLISCQIGDGSIAALDTTGPFPDKVRLLGEADSGEFSGQTDFITSPRFQSRAELQRRTRVSRGRNDLVMLMTDGVADDYHPNETHLAELYFDLIANGILDRKADQAARSGEPVEVTLPEPAAYPWVDNPDIEIPLNYADRIMAATGLAPADLWEHRDVLARAAAALPPLRGESREARLAAWLDNYVRRGSFDDRTLVVLMLDGGTLED
ncbi:MAG: protein phosphatase 2C domain-containing protein [Clostridia bacterium]|nr:protein phosphatase 2C domain-containing protein [Clostridia bacterium]